ncbi:hypothetical protein HK104_002029, partial [Borealophlyctis nickersoniae]
LHGTHWNPDNPVLDCTRNPGLREKGKNGEGEEGKKEEGKVSEAAPLFRLTPEQEKSIRRRTSCDLFECIDVRIPEHIGKKIFAQVVMAVHYLHSHGIVHRDLKDENIVIDANYWVKLVDFGSASTIPKRTSEYFQKFNGTAHFASPEIASGNPYRGPEAEVWSLGVLLFTIIFGENPFQNREEILKGEYKFPARLDPGCANLIDRMLTYRESQRATMDEVSVS